MNKQIIVLVGSSGSGKNRLAEYLESQGVPRNITNTSRKPRKGEQEGVHYFFKEKEHFFDEPLIEYAEYPSEDGMNYYGLSQREIEDKRQQYDITCAVMEINGAKAMKELYPEETVVVFVTVPLAEMERRMRERGDSEENIAIRLQQALDQKEHDHQGVADYVIENIDLEQSEKQLHAILSRLKNQ